MPEKINLRADTVAARFLQAAASRLPGGLNVKGALLAQVSLTVNGVEVPFDATCEQMAEEFRAQSEARAMELALAMITDAGLGQAKAALDEARRHVHRALRDLRERAPDDAERVTPL